MNMSIDDGYDGHWDPRRVAEDGSGGDKTKREVPAVDWKVELDKKKSTTMSLRREGDSWHWKCLKCGTIYTTLTFKRPEHICEEKKEK